MTGLFLRYCWRCNSTSTVVATNDATCAGCGEQTAAVDAHALIPALGNKLDRGQREVATGDALRGKPKGT